MGGGPPGLPMAPPSTTRLGLVKGRYSTLILVTPTISRLTGFRSECRQHHDFSWRPNSTIKSNCQFIFFSLGRPVSELAVRLLWQPSDWMVIFVILLWWCYYRRINMMMMMSTRLWRHFQCDHNPHSPSIGCWLLSREVHATFSSALIDIIGLIRALCAVSLR